MISQNNKHREITFEDIASFVESKARALNRSVFGTINTECRNQGRTFNDRKPRRSVNFATLGGEPYLGILSVVSSVYDPLGFAAPFILPAKVLLQDLCRKNLGWEDPISDEDLTRWRNWLEELPRLEDLRVDCCFKPINFGEVTPSQLHHFADASQYVYGTATYLHLTNSKGDVHCSFIIGKSWLGKASKYRHRVTPMPINRVPIFSDSVSIGTDFIGTD